ncbi:aldehyde dehydrogenase family protein [Candidatus Nitrospira neomarina]|uniref:Aldehyde dehydrogenase family protein n=1 Tax=Candidatus Nitrospira neomarina TaxID=3020899 RepID=A0AA96GPS9_9BACT|nr:aldehyde dehydrogenase family protein [Candidatus Nitrospira neomarina]WNM63138.1 aldehyde dehydrogenase family protein [Candidatus Nitrospira neomarina]
MMLDVRNPVSNEVVGTVPCDTPQSVEKRIANLKSYDQTLNTEERSEILRRAADLLNARKEDFSIRITQEAGICIKESRREVDRACINLRVSASETERIHGEALRVPFRQQNKLALTIYEPVGLVCAITPFNRPLNQVVVKVAPSFGANNSIIVKPSEVTPLSALAFMDLMYECGMPENAGACSVGFPEEIGSSLLQSQCVDMVTFTGSVETGERIMKMAGLKKTLMELGGNDPLIVLADADLRHAAAVASAGAFGTAGQSCRGVKRIIVMDEVADAFLKLLMVEARKLRIGDPFDPQTDIGSLISVEAAKQVEARCLTAVANGARLLMGGQRDGPFMQATVLDNVSQDSDLIIQETFGPVAPLIRVNSLEEALRVANSTPYGLQAGVITNNIRDFFYLASKLRVGGVGLNEGPQFDSPHIPFGGVKRSGIGREGIRYTIREMSTVKTVLLGWGTL